MSASRDIMHYRTLRASVAGLSAMMVVLVLLFSGFLNASAFHKSYTDSFVASNGVAAGEARRVIEYAIKFHKPLENFAAMSEILTGVKNETSLISNIYVVRPDGRMLYDINGRVEGELPASLMDKATSDSKWVAQGGEYHSFLPIRNADDKRIGFMDVIFDGASIESRTSAYVWSSIKLMGLIAAAIIALLLAILFKMPLFDRKGRFLKLRLTILLAGVLCLTQIAYGFINIVAFESAYTALAKSNLTLVASIIARRIEQVISLGVTYNDLPGLDDWLRHISQSVHEVGRIDLRDKVNALIYSTSPSLTEAGAEQASWSLKELLSADSTGSKATLLVAISGPHIEAQVRNLALDALTVFLTSLFFMAEMVVFIGVLLRKQILSISAAMMHPAAQSEPPASILDDVNAVRPLAFLLLLSSYVSVTFIPLLGSQFREPLFGLSAHVTSGLPIAAEMFGALLSSIFVGGAIDRKGWRPPFLAGILALACGTAACAFATGPLALICFRAVTGLGYGAAWMGLRGLVAAGRTDTSRTKGFSLLAAGIAAGQICGAVLGAMVAERMGFGNAFLFATGIALVTGLLALFVFENIRPESAGASKVSLKRIGTFFFHRDLIAFFLLLTIPTAITSAFLTYYFPLFAKSIGVTQGNVGRAFLLYGICIIFLGPLLISWASARIPGRQLMIASCLTTVGALLVFCAMPTFAGVLIAIFLLGLAEGLGLVSQNSYFITLPAPRALGFGKALSFYSAVKKVGQMTGPGIFGFASVLGASLGVGAVAAGYLLTTLVYALTLQAKDDPAKPQ